MDTFNVTLSTGQAKAKQKIRMTEMAKYKGLAKSILTDTGLISGGGILKAASGKQAAREVAINSDITALAMEGLDGDQVVKLIGFFLSALEHVEGCDDWGEMGQDAREDWIDLNLNPADLIAGFIQIWIVYQGINARGVKRG
ncbi:MAG: hypothetical protein FKY71_08890 [Spiribacter salinus]|uniref:Uncharacterized protein n=1 Tax=Spiribacter salinus TaxID=1335746 RepID=A0A540VRT1_9GAMM|nr:MAG: hypothetical protein FKY71_08890 [Spiribacter salinus]